MKQCSPPVDEGTLPIEGPELSGRANTAPPPLNIPPPEKAAEPPDQPSPEQIRAPIDAEGLLEPSRGEASQRVTQHKSQALAWALEGSKPLGEAHGHPPDLLDLCFEDSITLELDFVVRRRGGLSSSRGNACVPIRGLAQVLSPSIRTSCVGSEQNAAPYAPHTFHFSPSLDTCARGTAPGKGAAPVRHAADPYLEALTPPHLCEDSPDEAGGVGLGPIHAAGKAGTKAVERVVIDAHEPGGASLDVNAAPAPTEGTASVELFGVAKNAATAEPEALEPRAEGEAWLRLEKPPLPPSQKDPGVLGTPPREALNKGMRRCGLEAPPPPRESPSEGERGPQQTPRETPRAGVLALQESGRPS